MKRFENVVFAIIFVSGFPGCFAEVEPGALELEEASATAEGNVGDDKAQDGVEPTTDVRPLNDVTALKGLLSPGPVNAITPGPSGSFLYNGGVSGINLLQVVGAPCAPGTLRVAKNAYSSGAGYCEPSDWVNPNDWLDCRFKVHVAANPSQSGTCYYSTQQADYTTFSFTAENTASATQNTTNYSIQVQAGQKVIAGSTCGLPGAWFSGDTFYRLIGPNGQTVVYSDDSCGVIGSKFEYVVPTSGTYVIKAGCYSDKKCSGAVTVSVQ